MRGYRRRGVQTATSEVLQVISSSPGELEPVFNSMLENATRLCDAKFGTLNLYDGSAFRIAAVALSRRSAPACWRGPRPKRLDAGAERRERARPRSRA
jgi:hypothetical protein